jgi:Ca2+-binding RTX toxin-like protein
MRRGVAAVLAGLALLAGAQAAEAATSCTYDAGTHTVALAATATGESIFVQRQPFGGDTIQWGTNGVTSGNCGAATVSNTDTITYADSSGGSNAFIISFQWGSFTPGFSSEGGFLATPEIEFNVDFGAGTADELIVRAGGGSPLEARFGDAGVNLNSDEVTGVDSDLTLTGPPDLYLVAGDNNNDDVDASGGAGTGNATSLPFSATGGEGNDRLVGGLGADMLLGQDGADTLAGGPGADRLIPGSGDDGVDGGADGGDSLEYTSEPGPINFDLSVPGPQNTGASGTDSATGIEKLLGSGFDDHLTGSAGADTLDGDEGADVLAGAGGDDLLTGYNGNDALIGGPGSDTLDGMAGDDTLDSVDGAAVDNDLCGDGADSARADDVDTVAADCEQVARVALPPPPDTTAPTLTSLSLLRARFAVGPRATAVSARAKRGTAFRYTLTEPATVTIRIERRVRGVRKGKRCVRPTRRLRRHRKCTRSIRAGTLTRQSKAGASRVAFSGRIGRRALKPGRYRATLVATDAAHNTSKPKRLKFRVVRR